MTNKKLNLEVVSEIKNTLFDVDCNREYISTLGFLINEVTDKADPLDKTLNESFFMAGYELNRVSPHLEIAHNLIDQIDKENDNLIRKIYDLLKKIE